MILNLKDKELELPNHLRSNLVGLHEGTLEALRTYTSYMDILPHSVSVIILDEGFGDIGQKCQWAEKIAAEFRCVVKFSHDDIPTICHHRAAAAAGALWQERAREKEGE